MFSSDPTPRLEAVSFSAGGSATDDEELHASCAECHDLHMAFLKHCKSNDDLDAGDDQVGLVSARDSWLAAADRVIRRPARTRGGLIAKAAVVRGLLDDRCTCDDQTAIATRSLIQDVERLLCQ